jgi:hypothetical protein
MDWTLEHRKTGPNHHFTMIKRRHVALANWDQYMYMVQRAERAVNE